MSDGSRQSLSAPSSSRCWEPKCTGVTISESHSLEEAFNASGLSWLLSYNPLCLSHRLPAIPTLINVTGRHLAAATSLPGTTGHGVNAMEEAELERGLKLLESLKLLKQTLLGAEELWGGNGESCTDPLHFPNGVPTPCSNCPRAAPCMLTP